MPRNRARSRSGSLAPRSEGLDHPARLLEHLERDWPDLPVRTLIRTGVIDSRFDGGRPRGYASPRAVRPRGLLPSPDLRVRATFRSVFEPARHMRSVLLDEELRERALACGRRVIRKEVLFALRKTGKGSRQRRRVRREDSKFRC